MPVGFRKTLVAAVALVFASGTQRMLLVTCEAPARASCACPSGKGMEAFAAMKATALRCCDVVVLPAAVPQVAQERAAKAIPAPILVLVPGQLAITQPVS